MSTKLRQLLASQILQVANADVKTASTINEIAKGFTLRQGKNAQPELHLNVRQLKDALRLDDSKAASEEFVERIHHQCFENASPQKGQKPGSLAFAIDSNYFTADTLSASTGEPITEPKQKIVIEFSSPNIAKPFHMGHLRSTIIGNALSNLYQAFGHDVTRINYLGDWGTQFGMLKIGMDAAALSEAEIKANPIKHLFEAYVAANKLAESDPSVRERARQVFCSLENGDQGDLAEWAAYREYTVAELSAVYDRLGIRFDEYAWESQYSKQKISDCLALMKEKDLLQQDDEGKTYVEIGDAQVTLLKSDGSTMYLTRDVAAIMDRQRRLKYDKMLYVVDNGQSTHFTQLFEIAKRLGVANVDGLQHVKFGRINKMSTRKGNVVFLKDILDEARNISMEYQLNEPSTKVDAELIESHTGEVIGCSSIIINDFRRKRMANYDFDWHSALQIKGDSGRVMHLDHSRMCSLRDLTGIVEAETCRPELLLEPEAINLIYCIARYPQILLQAKDTHEPCALVKYCYELCKEMRRALKVLYVKNEPNQEIQRQRMLLFMQARRTLHASMTILGLQPLEKM